MSVWRVIGARTGAVIAEAPTEAEAYTEQSAFTKRGLACFVRRDMPNEEAAAEALRELAAHFRDNYTWPISVEAADEAERRADALWPRKGARS